MDYGVTAQNPTGQWNNPKQRPNYFMLMKQRFELARPPIEVRSVPKHIAGFIVDDLFLSSSISKPIGNLYVGTHAQSEGYLFIRLFDRQVDALGDPADDITDYEIMGQTGAPKIPDSLIGYTRGTPPTPDPPPTKSFNIKGCNIGRNRFFPSTGKPIAPFLVRLKNSFGSNVIVTAPKHFHGLIDETNHQGIFEYMAHEFVVRTKAVRAERSYTGDRTDGFRGFKDRGELIAAYKDANNPPAAAKLRYYDGTPVPDDAWDALIPRGPLRENRGLSLSLPLGKAIENITDIPVNRQFRIEIDRVRWVFSAGVTIPSNQVDRLKLLRDSMLADSRYDPNHVWPLYERKGYPDIDSYIAGHDWAFPARPSTSDPNIVIGRHFDYTIVQPISDRSVAAPAKAPLIFNFYPGPGSTDAAVLTGLVETDNRFFGRV